MVLASDSATVPSLVPFSFAGVSYEHLCGSYVLLFGPLHQIEAEGISLRLLFGGSGIYKAVCLSKYIYTRCTLCSIVDCVVNVL